MLFSSWFSLSAEIGEINAVFVARFEALQLIPILVINENSKSNPIQIRWIERLHSLYKLRQISIFYRII